MKLTPSLFFLIAVLCVLCFGCDEGMNMVDSVITDPIVEPGTNPATNGEVKQPDPQPTPDPGKQEPETPAPEPQPAPTLTIDTVVQEDDGSITVSGTSTDVPEGAMVTTVLGDNAITMKTTVDKDGAWSVMISAKKAEKLAVGTVTVKATAKKMTAASSFEYTPEPEPTITIETITNEDDGSVTVSGTSADLPAGETVTVTLAEMITITTTVDEVGSWTTVVSAAEAANLAAGRTVVTAAAKKATIDSSFDYTPPAPTVVPPGTPAWLIPPPNTVLSEFERALIEVDQVFNDDGVTASMTAAPTGKPVDQISSLPYKDREEVYEQFIQFVEAEYDLPFFREAAELMAEININLRILGGKYGGTSTEYQNYLEKAEIQRGIHHTVSSIVIDHLETAYFEEKPEDKQYIGRDDVLSGDYSRYWIILEYYRLRLEHPKLAEWLRERKAGSFFEMLELFRKSVQEGYVFGLDNPWN